VSVRWQVKGIPLEVVNENGGCVGEPFAMHEGIVLTKEAVFWEGDEEKSSEHHPQMERERG